MSLATTPEPPPQFPVAILAAKDFDSRDFLEDMIGEKLANIAHVYTNGANDIVTDFARANGLPYTVYPIAGGRGGLPVSTREIVERSSFVYIIATAHSKSAEQVRLECEKKGVKHRVIEYDPISYWREKVCKIAEIVAAMPKDEREASEYAKAVWRVL